MPASKQKRSFPARDVGLLVRLSPCLILLAVFLAGAVQAQTRYSPEAAGTAPRAQVLDGRISRGSLQLYRISGLKKGETLHVHAATASGNLDPLIALLRPDVDAGAFAQVSLRESVEALSPDHDPIEITRKVFDRYALAWNDDFEGQYRAAFATEIPADGDYWLAVGSSLVRASAGAYRLSVGVDEPDVLSREPASTGPAFVFPDNGKDAPEKHIVTVTGELKQDQPVRYYYLTDLPAGQTFYAYAEAISGGLKPVLTLLDHSDKPVAYANFAAAETRTVLRYRLPEKAERYRLKISSQVPDGRPLAGNFRLTLGLNAPEVMDGEGESTGRGLLREAIEVGVGLKLQQLTAVDQKAENFGVVGTLVMHWRDPALAFDPETVQDRFRIFEGDTFSAEMSRRGQLWPQFTIINQQGNRWVQNRVVVVTPDGEAAYLERFSTTLQAPDFDFRDFPFDEQNFFIRVDLLAPDWIYQLREIEGYSEVGGKLGEEEWVVTGFDTSFSQGDMLNRPVSRFNFHFEAKRHVEYYFFRILLPLTVIIAVSWVLFFLKDYAKRVDAAGANLLVFIAFNFAISNDLPRLGYLTFLDTLLISAFLVTAVVLILAVYLRRQDMKGRDAFVAKVDHYVVVFYPLAYIVTIATVTFLFR